MEQSTTRQIILLSVLLETNITLLHAPSQAAAFVERHAYWTCVVAAIVLCLCYDPSVWEKNGGSRMKQDLEMIRFIDIHTSAALQRM
ncbi:hypothetical protein ABH897_001782 [Paenibacillus sp. RC73]|uniref:hypothetical protein n=1 Tax=Paenibacillus sp. RC73 TaxID=3156250 RepID=UPI00383352C5